MNSKTLLDLGIFGILKKYKNLAYILPWNKMSELIFRKLMKEGKKRNIYKLGNARLDAEKGRVINGMKGLEVGGVVLYDGLFLFSDHA